MLDPSADPSLPTADDMRMARTAMEQISGLTQQPLRVAIEDADTTVELPALAVDLLAKLLSTMASGNTLLLRSIPAELTPFQAAELLGASRLFVEKEIAEGRLASHKIGVHRRILTRDLLAYKRVNDTARRAAIDALARMDEELSEE
ncbi:MAG: excisionase family DNA-binding protein [Planctomycetes bacterium]|nr:excisionase family DNA-binding protein [Planctomycetota bacterium]